MSGTQKKTIPRKNPRTVDMVGDARLEPDDNGFIAVQLPSAELTLRWSCSAENPGVRVVTR